MTIEVTKQDIINGVRCNPSMCPVALAVKRVVNKQLKHLSVNYKEVWYQTKDNVVVSELPVEAIKFIGAYDFRQPVKPFNFTLKVTGEYPIPQ
jgi:hypothetical protein